MPPGYGVPTDGSGAEHLPWTEVDGWLAHARNYWVCTTRADGRPHAAPVWGLWRDDVFVFSTSRASLKGRNLARTPDVLVHTGSGDEVAILEGAVTETRLTNELAEDYEAKYAFRPTADEGSAWYALRPRSAQVWRERDFPLTATRWVF